ncbi:MAG TPA: hypothetical protein VN667_17905 [Burkholderiales bacterium]|nr:hypothetical protein [Burkholderiales bacterium]
MISTEAFFTAFDQAGFLTQVSWTPSLSAGGGPAQTPKVRFRETDHAANGTALSTEYTIEYPATVLVGLKRGEVVMIAMEAYTVREEPSKQLDGSRLMAKLRKGA